MYEAAYYRQLSNKGFRIRFIVVVSDRLGYLQNGYLPAFWCQICCNGAMIIKTSLIVISRDCIDGQQGQLTNQLEDIYRQQAIRDDAIQSAFLFCSYWLCCLITESDILSEQFHPQLSR